MPDWRFWLPTTVSVFALGFAALQWSETRQQRQLSVRPSLSLLVEDDDAEPTVGVQVESRGPGPAVIQSVAYYIDLKPVKDDEEAARYCKLDRQTLRLMEFDPGDNFGVNRPTGCAHAARRTRRNSIGSLSALTNTLASK